MTLAALSSSALPRTYDGALAGRSLVTVVLAALSLAACGQPGSSSSSSPAPSSTPPPPAPSAEVFVSDETGGNIVIVDAGSGEVRERIAVGKRPRGLRISPDRTLVYVALSGSPIAGPGVDESKLPP